ncbi:unnamed protein product [Lactuca virosa]|uniref:Uncharacterized protein n=1 Tax=Lactuca virosa TaxID=75947 RepID=A0AAU9P0E7_9ASTR|nr:unnamed protein product [Lactuca virosa]
MSKKIGISVMVKRLQRRVFARTIKDVKEGHFAVIAVNEHEERRFVVPVAYLERASFVRLLERAAEEFGFNYEGAVVIPCRPSELQRLLAEQSA